MHTDADFEEPNQKSSIVIRTQSEALHESPAHRPHARPLAVDVHRNCHQKTKHLNTANSQEHGPRAVRLQPADNEQREDETVKNV